MPTSFHLAQGFTAAALIATGLPCILGCQKDDEPTTQTIVVYVDTMIVPPGAVADVDGNIYSTTTIGSQRWMAENLRASHYRNGDPIPYVPDDAQWTSLTTGAWTNYNTDAAYDGLYGKLYNWYTLMDPRNVCPSGWHVPSDSEWMELEQILGVPVDALDNTGPRGISANAGGQLKSLLLWDDPNTGATDLFEFSAFPGGQRTLSGGSGDVGAKGFWWTTSEFNGSQGMLRSLASNNAGIYRFSTPKVVGASIRCVED